MPIPGPYHITQGAKIKQAINGPTTERLLIIGTAVDGPINSPMPITSASQAESIFGPASYSRGYLSPITSSEDGLPNGATLPLFISQAINAGCTNIYAVRASGSYAAAVSGFNGKLYLRSIYPGRIYNSVSVTVTAMNGTLLWTQTQPNNKLGSFSTTFASTLSIGQIADLVNADRRNTTLYVDKSVFTAYVSAACTTLVSGTATVSGGTNGTSAPGEDYFSSKTGYATLLTATDTGTFDMIEGMGFPFNIAVLTGVYFDDQVVDTNGQSVTIGTDFAVWLDKCSTTINPCHGVMGTRPHGIRDRTALINYVNTSLLATTAAFYDAAKRWTKAGAFLYAGFKRTDPVEGVVDMGRRLSVCAGCDVIYTHPDIGTYADNFHGTYAAMLTTYPPEKEPTFSKLPGVLAYTDLLPTKYADLLVQGVGYDGTNDISGKGAFVTLTRSLDGGGSPVIYSPVTTTDREDYFFTYQPIHLANSVHSAMALAFTGYYGSPTDQKTRAAMETTIQNILDGYAQSGALKGKRGVGYDYEVVSSARDEALGIIRVNVELWPARALQKIVFTVAVKTNM